LRAWHLELFTKSSFTDFLRDHQSWIISRFVEKKNRVFP
jgi:hypothetical protein